MHSQKYYSKDEALELLRRYCVYQDRCHSEVRSKLLKIHIYGEDLEEIIADLITDDFLNEERFAKAYVSGKYKIKSWGRVKIEQHLKQKKVSSYCIKQGLAEIDEEEYLDNLRRIISKRLERNTDFHRLRLATDLMRYAQSRGYTYHETKPIIDELVDSAINAD